MIAMPLNNAKESSALALHFGKAEAFALFDSKNGQMRIIPLEGAARNTLIVRLHDLGATDLIVHGMGAKSYSAAQLFNVQVWFSGTDRLLPLDAIRRFQKRQLISVTPENEYLLRQRDRANCKHEQRCCGYDTKSDGPKPKLTDS